MAPTTTFGGGEGGGLLPPRATANGNGDEEETMGMGVWRHGGGHPGVALGPDGHNDQFFQKNWDLVNMDMSKLLNDFL